METGRVKQAYNNEIISLRKNFNQAKIQIIHKLTRKAKTLAEKKAPEKLKEKLKRKAESAVKEVLIMKKVKPRDIGKFAVTHTGKLQDYLNKPTVDQDKACARLLLHKSLQEKYKFIRSTFSNIPISDLLMSRSERLKLKKEALMEKKLKKDKKRKKVVNSEGEWQVENVKSNKNNEMKGSDEDQVSGDDNGMESDKERNSEVEGESDDEEKSLSDVNEQSEPSDAEMEIELQNDQESSDEDSLKEEEDNAGKFVRLSPVKDEKHKLVPEKKNAVNIEKKTNSPGLPPAALNKNKHKPEIKKQVKVKDAHKNKNLNEKLLSRKFKKDLNDVPVKETKIVDPFFITETGENYMSLAEPRQPDEVKEIHKQGNRKLRRAAMFGHVPKIKPRQDVSQDSYDRQNYGKGGFRNNNRTRDDNYNNTERNDSQFRNKNNRFEGGNDQEFRNKNDSQFRGRNESQFKSRNDKFRGNVDSAEPKVEKLHPSWEAKKKQSGILPFQGKKIVFNES